MEQWYDSVFDHLMWAQVRLEARVNVLNALAHITPHQVAERSRVGRVLRRLRMCQTEMRQSFDPTEPTQRDIPF